LAYFYLSAISKVIANFFLLVPVTSLGEFTTCCTLSR